MGITPGTALLTDRLCWSRRGGRDRRRRRHRVRGIRRRPRVCDRDAEASTYGHRGAGRGPDGHDRMLDARDGDAVRTWVANLPARRCARQQCGRWFPRGLLRCERQGSGLARQRELHERHELRSRGSEDARRRAASIVNITSIEAHRAAPGYAVYSAMKAAVTSLTKSLALELGVRRIRVNCVAPDVIPTPGIGGEMPVKTALPIAGHVDDVAGAVVYLASDLARFVTGVTLHVDGGNWRRAAGSCRRRDLDGGGAGGVKFGVVLGALNPHFHLDATIEAERLGFESVWLPEHLVFTRTMTSSPHPGENIPPVPPTPHLRRVPVPCVPRGPHRTAPARHTRLQHRAAPSIHCGARRPDGRPALGRPLRVRHRRVVARAGVGCHAARLLDARAPRRRSGHGVQAVVDRGDDLAPRRVLRVRRGRVRTKARAEAVAADPRRRRVEGGAAARGRLGDGWIGMGHTLESASVAIAPLRELLGEQGAIRRRSRSCSAARSRRAPMSKHGRRSA